MKRREGVLDEALDIRPCAARGQAHADLIRVVGIGPEFAELLEASGVDSVPELAQRNVDNLVTALKETNDARSLVRRVPAAAEVTDWIEQAKTLPRVVAH